MNRAGCPCATNKKSPHTSPYSGGAGGYGQSNENYTGSSPHCKPSGAGFGQRSIPQSRPHCGPQPCGRPICPKSSKPPTSITPIASRPLTNDMDHTDDSLKGFEMNNATWSLCAAVALFCCGVYLTKKMATVASELG